MSTLLLASLSPLAGKTTFAVGLAQRFTEGGKRVTLLRLEGDEASVLDAVLFSGLAFNNEPRRAAMSSGEIAQGVEGADFTIVEAPAGNLTAGVRALPARIVVAARDQELTDGQLAAFCQSLGDAFLGVVAVAVPRSRLESARRFLTEDVSLPLLAFIPEDRTLASPSITELAGALTARAMFLNDRGQIVLDRIMISSISADPSQGYFARYNPNAVIIRSDKPDLQLAALNAGIPCLVLTGGMQPLSYVLQRAEEDDIPILLTQYDTVTAVTILENLYASTRFGGEAKVRRIGQLMAESLEAETLNTLIS